MRSRPSVRWAPRTPSVRLGPKRERFTASPAHDDRNGAPRRPFYAHAGLAKRKKGAVPCATCASRLTRPASRESERCLRRLPRRLATSGPLRETPLVWTSLCGPCYQVVYFTVVEMFELLTFVETSVFTKRQPRGRRRRARHGRPPRDPSRRSDTWPHRGRIYLMFVFGKNEASTLTADQKKKLREVVAQIKATDSPKE